MNQKENTWLSKKLEALGQSELQFLETIFV